MEYTVFSIAPIVLLPFLAFVISAFTVKKSQTAAMWIAVAGIVSSFFFASRVFFDFIFGKYSAGAYIHKYFTWFDLSYGAQIFKVDMGIYIDNMTAILLLMVTGVASLIHIFSTFYMKDDEEFGRFFVYMILFTTGMIGLALSDNLLSVFIFWEIMGFCSYSLIGFYNKKESAAQASIKAFMTTRVGDVFFLLGIAALWSVVGNVTFVDIYAAIHADKFAGLTIMGVSFLSFVGVSLFMGTVGKSAQFPLQVWLPDAMQGPTPCSALIHAATMVAGGVYLALRIYPILEAGDLLVYVAYIGAITALGAATIALVQTDIKAVLAYSTISQLGYMVMGIGVEAYNASFMHLITHAVFKACLFLAAGSVIHSLHDHHTHGHVQEMPRMGGLRKKLPYTFWAMMFCTLAIAGVPLFSGFVSKDRILGEALLQAGHSTAYIPVAVMGFSAAFLTAFYMFRMMFLTFFGEPRDKEVYHHAHQEHLQWNRNVPLLILAVFTLGFFFSGSPTGQKEINLAGGHFEWFETLVQKPHLAEFSERSKTLFSTTDETASAQFPVSHYEAGHGMSEEEAHHAHHVHLMGALLSIFIAASGIGLAWMMYYKKAWNPASVVGMFSGYYRTLQNKYYFDDFYIKGVIGSVFLPFNRVLAYFDLELYDRYVVDGVQRVSTLFYKVARWFDNVIVDTIMVDGTGAAVRFLNVIMRAFQSGKIQLYFIVALIVLAGYILALI